MGLEDVENYIRKNRNESDQKISSDDIETHPECAYCGTEMPYQEYNEHSPGTDYIKHIIPGEDEQTPTGQILYCSAICFINDMKKITEKES